MYLGIDTGGTSIKCGALGEDNNLADHASVDTLAHEGKDRVLERIFRLIAEYRQKYEIKSIGMGMPGVVNSEGVLLFSPNLPGWENVELKKILEDKFDLPVALDNDANVAAYAELETGAGHDISNFLYVTLGTGVGGCIILNGEIVRGTIGGAGEFGHTIIKADDNEEDFEKSYRTGVLEEYIGKNQIINLAKKIMEEFPRAELGKIKNPDVRQISEFISKGDPVAIECFKRVGHYLGVGITSVLNLLDLRVAIIGGGISQAHSMLLETALQTIRRRALPSIAGEAEVRLAEFSNDAGMIGAALLGKSSI